MRDRGAKLLERDEDPGLHLKDAQRPVHALSRHHCATCACVANQHSPLAFMCRISRSSTGMRERWPVMCGCMVNRNRPPSSQAPSNSAVKISSTAEGGVYGRNAENRTKLKYTASSRIHSGGSSTSPVGSPASISS